MYKRQVYTLEEQLTWDTLPAPRELTVADANTFVYVCGLKGMEEGVAQAFADACRSHGVDWDAVLPRLRAEGRYHLETY